MSSPRLLGLASPGVQALYGRSTGALLVHLRPKILEVKAIHNFQSWRGMCLEHGNCSWLSKSDYLVTHQDGVGVVQSSAMQILVYSKQMLVLSDARNVEHLWPLGIRFLHDCKRYSQLVRPRTSLPRRLIEWRLQAVKRTWPGHSCLRFVMIGHYFVFFPALLLLILTGILERGITIDGLGSRCFTTYESSVLFALRFMIDCDIVGGNWIELPAGSYRRTARNMSYCQLEVDIFFDIECAGRKGHFPEPNQDPVIQIANLVTLQGEDRPFVRNVLTLRSCSPIVGVDVMSFDTEREVLLAWRVSSLLFISVSVFS
eukprot:Gb_15179 [translate_table: standard]